MHETNPTVNAFYTSARVPALPFFLVDQSCPHCSLLPGYDMAEWKGKVSNVLSSRLLWRVESSGSAACEAVNSVVMRCTSWLARAQGIIAHSLHSSESTGRSMGQRLRALQCSWLDFSLAFSFSGTAPCFHTESSCSLMWLGWLRRLCRAEQPEIRWLTQGQPPAVVLSSLCSGTVATWTYCPCASAEAEGRAQLLASSWIWQLMSLSPVRRVLHPARAAPGTTTSHQGAAYVSRAGGLHTTWLTKPWSSTLRLQDSVPSSLSGGTSPSVIGIAQHAIGLGTVTGTQHRLVCLGPKQPQPTARRKGLRKRFGREWVEWVGQCHSPLSSLSSARREEAWCSSSNRAGEQWYSRSWKCTQRKGLTSTMQCWEPASSVPMTSCDTAVPKDCTENILERCLMERAGAQERCQTTRNGLSLPVSHSGGSTKRKGATPSCPLVPWHGRELQCLPLAPWQGTGSSFQKRPQESTGAEKAVFPRGEVMQAGPHLQWGVNFETEVFTQMTGKNPCAYTTEKKNTTTFSLSISLASMMDLELQERIAHPLFLPQPANSMGEVRQSPCHLPPPQSIF